MLKILSFLTLEMLGKIMTHVRNISVELFKEKIIYSIPKYLPHECKDYRYEVKEYPDKIEVVAILKDNGEVLLKKESLLSCCIL